MLGCVKEKENGTRRGIRVEIESTSVIGSDGLQHGPAELLVLDSQSSPSLSLIFWLDFFSFSSSILYMTTPKVHCTHKKWRRSKEWHELSLSEPLTLLLLYQRTNQPAVYY